MRQGQPKTGVMKNKKIVKEAGFVFRYNTIEAAFQDILERSNKTGG